MRNQRLIAAVLAFVLCLPASAFAQDHYTEQYSLDIQAADFMGRLYEVLTREEWLGSVPEVRGFAEVAREMGLFNFSGLQTDYSVQDGQVFLRYEEHYDGVAPESLIGQMYALPNKSLLSAGYVNPDNFVLYLGAANVPQHAFLAVDELGRMAATPDSALTQMLGEEAASLAEGIGMLHAFNVQQQAEEILTGEIALALFEVPALEKLTGDFQPGDLNMAMFVGLKDASRLRELAAAFGAQAGLEPLAGDLGAWTGYKLPGLYYGGIVFNDEMLIVAPNIYTALATIDFTPATLSTQPVQFMADVNLTRLHDGFVGPLAMSAMAEIGGDLQPASEAAAYLFALPASSQLGRMQFATTYGGSGYACEMHMNTAFVNYLFYYLGVGAGVAAANH